MNTPKDILLLCVEISAEGEETETVDIAQALIEQFEDANVRYLAVLPAKEFDAELEDTTKGIIVGSLFPVNWGDRYV